MSQMTATPLTDEALNAMKLWQLLGLALRDLRKHERTPGCVVDMDVFLTLNDGLCYACLAGAVMIHSLGIDNSRRLSGWELRLDALRRGVVPYDSRRRTQSRSVPHYSDDPRQWWRDMGKLYHDLKENDE